MPTTRNTSAIIGAGLTLISTVLPLRFKEIPESLLDLGIWVGLIMLLWGVWPHVPRFLSWLRTIKVEPSHLIIVGIVGALLFAGVAGAGLIWQQRVPPRVVAVWADGGKSNLEGRPLAWNKTLDFGNHIDARGALFVRSIGVSGQNIGSEEVALADVYLISKITGKRLDLKINAHGAGLMSSKDVNPIPPGAHMLLSTDELNTLKPTDGVPESDFLNEWGRLDLVAEYGGTRHRVSYDRGSIAEVLNARKPQPLGPHVSPKQK